MKIALVTTTVNIPHVLKLYRAASSDVKFFVVGDEKTDHYENEKLCAQLSNDVDPPSVVYLPPNHQNTWKCSEPIGWKSIQRRNIGFLEALRWGADVIVSVDDDNFPVNQNYFDDYLNVLCGPFNGLQATAPQGFFDSGEFLIPRMKQRGIPHGNKPYLEIDGVTGARVGVAQGMCIGAADIDAATRYSPHPDVHQISEVVRAGVVVNPLSNTIWNSQNTAVIRELIPAWFMWPFCGRHDDIYASVFTHRIMRDRGLHAHYGLPMVWQHRNQHDVVKDMRAEIEGYANVKKLANVLDHTVLPGVSVLEDCRRLWRTLSTCDWVPGRTIQAAEAYLTDCEGVL